MAGFSAGILDIILNTYGELPPPQLRAFLNQVRGKKKAAEIAAHFTGNIPALANQLYDVETAYIRRERKGSKMDKDIDFIRKLRKRLQAWDKRDVNRLGGNRNISVEQYQRKDISKGAYSEVNLFRSSSSVPFFEETEDEEEDEEDEEFSESEPEGPPVASTSRKQPKMHFQKKQLKVPTPKRQSKIRRTMKLSSGTVKIIFDTSGVLHPDKLCDFLEDVFGKKNAEDIARYYTSNIHGLVKQLQKVKENYLKQGRRGVIMDKDIDFIRRLIKRLEGEKNQRREVEENQGHIFEGYSRETYFREFM